MFDLVKKEVYNSVNHHSLVYKLEFIIFSFFIETSLLKQNNKKNMEDQSFILIG
jgi:hypothetical protein